jgi:glycosyltransferase involved in cell wall biosynthesis
MIYIEPATYVVDLIKVLSKNDQFDIEIIFLEHALSQGWSSDWDLKADVLKKGFLPGVQQLWCRIRDGNYDVIHLAGWGHPMLMAAHLIGSYFGTKIVVESDTPLPVKAILWKRLVRRILYPWFFRMANGFLPAGSLQAEYLRHYGVGDDRISIARMTVDVAAMKRFAGGPSESGRNFRQAFGINADQILIAYVGRLEPHKGIWDLFEAFEQLKQDRVNLLIVGEGSLSMEVERRARANTRITAAGRLEGEELWSAYLATDILVLPSLFEPWGLVVNEAMAHGVPVVVSDVVGCRRDLVEHDVTGIEYEAGNADDLAMQLARLVEAPELRQRLTQAASTLIGTWTLEDEAAVVQRMWRELHE